MTRKSKFRKPIEYYDECWQQMFWLMEGWTKKQAVSFFNTLPGFHDQDISLNQGKTFYNTDGTGPILIWTGPTKTIGARAAILAHECIHAAHITLDRAGVKPDFNNDEAVTYLVTVLMRKALRDL